MGYNSACVGDFCDIFASIGGFRGWTIECCQLHFFRPIPVAMATKFGTKWAITRLAQEIFARFLRLYGGFQRWAIECCQLHFPRLTPVAMATKFGTNWLKFGLYKRFFRDFCAEAYRGKGFGDGPSNAANCIFP